MTKAKAKKTRPPRKAIPNREPQGSIEPHNTTIVRHKEGTPIEKTFATAALKLFTARDGAGFLIVRGILNLDEGFMSTERIIEVLSSGRHLDPIMAEPSRTTAKTTATHLPDIWNSLQTHIRAKLESCLAHLNKTCNDDPGLDWTDRNLRDDGYNTLILTTPVPEAERNLVQLSHLDFYGHQRQCLSCHVGISGDIRLQVYDDLHRKWWETTYSRGDVLLVQGHKLHRGTNHVEPPLPKLRAFYYIEDSVHADLLRAHNPFDDGAVFHVGAKDPNDLYDEKYAEEQAARLEQVNIIRAAKRERLEAHKAKRKEALRRRWSTPDSSSLPSPRGTKNTVK
jgi:hypothetical protein